MPWQACEAALNKRVSAIIETMQPTCEKAKRVQEAKNRCVPVHTTGDGRIYQNVPSPFTDEGKDVQLCMNEVQRCFDRNAATAAQGLVCGSGARMLRHRQQHPRQCGEIVRRRRRGQFHCGHRGQERPREPGQHFLPVDEVCFGRKRCVRAFWKTLVDPGRRLLERSRCRKPVRRSRRFRAPVPVPVRRNVPDPDPASVSEPGFRGAARSGCAGHGPHTTGLAQFGRLVPAEISRPQRFPSDFQRMAKRRPSSPTPAAAAAARTARSARRLR